MSELQRVTTDYLENEDRIRLSGETEEGDTVVLWLTQRLLLRLLPHVLEWLEKPGPVMQSPSSSDAYTTDARTRELMQGFAQQSASRNIPDEPPVQAGDTDDIRLVHTVDISTVATLFRLTFKAAGDKVSTLSFEAQHLRQWLSILHQLWLKAGWPHAVWPEWMEDGPEMPPPRRKALH